MTPLLAAIRNNETQLVKMLLNAGGDPNAKDCRGVTPLWFAVRHNNLELIKLLLSFGANVDTGKPDFTPLQSAASDGDVDLVNLLLVNNANTNMVCEGWSALTLASNPVNFTSDHVTVVDKLLRAGADPAVVPRNSDEEAEGCNALFEAVGEFQTGLPGPAEQKLRLQIVKLLVKAGSPVNARCAGRTPLDIARLLDEFDIAAFLLEVGGESTAFSSSTKSTSEY